MADIENFYDHLKNEKDHTRDYPTYKQVKIPLTSRILICGPTGSGKTNILMNLIKKIGVFTRIYLFCKTPEEKLYKQWIEKVRKLEEKHKQKILFVSDSLESLPDANQFDPEYTNLLVIDDFAFSKERQLEPVVDCWIRARKKNVTMIFLTQSYHKTPIDIRKNSDYLILKKLNTQKDINTILSEYNFGDVDRTILKKVYNKCIEGDFKNFMTIDCNCSENYLKFRKNLVPLDIRPLLKHDTTKTKKVQSDAEDDD